MRIFALYKYLLDHKNEIRHSEISRISKSWTFFWIALGFHTNIKLMIFTHIVVFMFFFIEENNARTIGLRA